ncbi:MAG: SUF system NifU family Fe-S cluster assembly protein [Gemmatimonadales bacterium]|nr:SUF system NifU family Fe-S cluster assembly protein [Gemmatimonadales bacterium]
MSELDELYQSVILDHNRSPRNFRALTASSGHAEGRNPLCGDSFEVWVDVKDGVVADVSFLGQGCAISKASASVMTTTIKGKSVTEAKALFERFHGLVTGSSAAPPVEGSSGRAPLGSLGAFAGVAAFPIRVKCATLAWHTMLKAIDETGSQR